MSALFTYLLASVDYPALINGSWSSGPLSSVWKEWIKWCIEFGIEANSIIAVPYDWRLSPSKLEERDLYFHKLKFVYILHISCAIVLLAAMFPITL